MVSFSIFFIMHAIIIFEVLRKVIKYMNSQRFLSINFFAFFFTWGVFIPYWTGWLTFEKGLSVAAASIIMGIGMFVRSFSTLILFPIFTTIFPLSKVIKSISLVTFFILLLYFPFDSYITLLFITIFLNLFYPNLLPAVESSATVLMKDEGVHYGKARSFGSIGYTIALIIVGLATSIFTVEAILWLMLIGIGFLASAQFQRIPTGLRNIPEARKIQSTNKKEWKHLLSGGFLSVLTVVILLQGSHASYYNYGFIFLEDLGVQSFNIGVILNIAVLSEIAFFAVVDRYFANMRVSTLYIIAACGSTLRWILIFLFPNVLVFTITQILHALSFGFAHYGFIRYISNNLSPKLMTTAQGMYSAFGMSLITALLTLCTGFLYEYSPKLSFLGMIICTIPALLVTFWTRKKFNY